MVTIQKMDWELVKQLSLGTLIDTLNDISDFKNPDGNKNKKEFGKANNSKLSNEDKYKIMLEKVKQARGVTNGK